MAEEQQIGFYSTHSMGPCVEGRIGSARLTLNHVRPLASKLAMIRDGGNKFFLRRFRLFFPACVLPSDLALGGLRRDPMRAVTLPSAVASQSPDAVDQLLFSDRLLATKEVARVLAISTYYKIQ